MSYDPLAVANTILDIAKVHAQTLTSMRLHKLIYFSHAWHVALDRGALSNEEAEAWRWGPCFPTFYHATKKWGSTPIVGPITQVAAKPGFTWLFKRRELAAPRIPNDDLDTLKFLKRIWDVYGGMTTLQLAGLTHDRDGPWRQAREDGAGIPVTIPNELLAAFYKSKILDNC